jgi:type IV secretion system protein VirB10
VPSDIGKHAPAPAAEDPEQQRLTQETEAARTSHLFATTRARERVVTTTPATPAADQKTASAGQAEGAPPLDPGSLLNMQDRKLAFANGAIDHKTVSPERLENPVSRYVIQADSIIPAALITGIRSDLPGQVTAQVTENVYYQNVPVKVTRNASGSIGCNTLSMTPFWHTAAGAVGGPEAGKHMANRESVLISDP